MERAIRGVLGEHVIVVFTAGFAGDVTQVDNLTHEIDLGGPEQARLVGGSVGAEAVKVLLRMTPGNGGPVKARSANYTQGRRRIDPKRLQQAKETAAQGREKAGVERWVFAKEYVMLAEQARLTPSVEVEVQVMQIGPALYAAAPGEMFTRFGLDIRKSSQFKLVKPVGLANGCVGYGPTPDAFEPNGGGYEQRMTSYTSLSPESGDRMVRVALELSARWTPTAIPTRKPRLPFTAPWDYGSAPPEK